MSDLVVRPPVKPVKLGHFTLTAQGVEIVGIPSRTDFLGAFDFICHMERMSGWWLVDMIRWADEHEDVIDAIEHYVDPTQIPESTLRRYRQLGREFPTAKRLAAAPMSHHLEVLVAPEEERVALLTEAVEEQLSVRELKHRVRAKRHLPVLRGQAAAEPGKYRVILADVPWPGTEGGSFAPLSYEHLAGLPVGQLALPSAVLFLWVPDRLLLATPGPVDILVNWGFTYRTGIVWDKVFGVAGEFGTSVRHEHLIVATVGNGLPDTPQPELDSLIVERKKATADPALKPTLVRRWIEQQWSVGPWLDLFSSIQHDGWDVYSGTQPATIPKKPKALPAAAQEVSAS